MAKSSPYPLYEKVIERLKEKGVILPPEVSPSYFLKHESDEMTGTIISEFWIEAHTLSCLTRGSFHASIGTTYNDAMSSLVKISDGGDDALGFVGEILTRNCAHVKSDGAIINSYGDKVFRTAFCIENSGIKMSKQQLRTIADLKGTHPRKVVMKQPINSTEGAKSQSSWLEYVASPVRTISRGLHNAIDSVLGDEFAQRTNIGESADMDDAIALSKPDLNQIDEDDEIIAQETRRGAINQQPVTNTDELISLDVIAYASERLLAYATEYCESEDMFFVLRSTDGTVDQMILHTNSANSGSLYSLCRRSGEYYSSCKVPNIADQNNAAKVLSTVSKEEMGLLAESLVSSNHAILDEETITLCPKGISSNYTKSKTDSALFQIHTTRMTIQHRMMSLEQHASVAEKNAVGAKTDGRAKLALMHMKRRRSILDELERCATIIANLDASELRLHRAKDDAQLVETFAMLKVTLQDIRTRKGVDKTNVEELMLDIQEELDATNLDSLHCGAIGPDIDEDELDAEFRQLELECAFESESAVDESCMKPAEISGVDENNASPKLTQMEETVSKLAESEKNVNKETSTPSVKVTSILQNQDPVPISN